VNKAGLVDVLGATGYENIQGELVQKLDEYANVSIGTIFAIFKKKTKGTQGTLEDCLQKGTDLITAGLRIVNHVRFFNGERRAWFYTGSQHR